MRRDKATLLNITEAAQAVLDFMQDMSLATFMSDFKTQSAVLYQLLVIGEAVKRLSDEFCAEHTEIPWSLIAGMRDHLIHGYDIIDWDEVWETATIDVATLLAQIEPLLPN